MPENPRIALAAVIVTGVVGVAGTAGTYIAAHDTQQQSARAELSRQDRFELRSVLDRAAMNLSRATESESTLWLDWSYRHRVSSRTIRDLRSLIRRVDLSRTQLAIRLGKQAEAYHSYAQAYGLLYDLRKAYNRYPQSAERYYLSESERKLTSAVRAFLDRAHALAGSMSE